MKIKRRIRIVSVTERYLSHTAASQKHSFFCRICDEQVVSLSINEATRFSRKSWREIVHLIERGEIHSSETANGEIYVCAASIVNDIKASQ